MLLDWVSRIALPLFFSSLLFHMLQTSIHLVDNHLPGVSFEFELVFEGRLRSLNKREIVPHLVEQDLKALQVSPHLYNITRIGT
jgi:hypothetical protein